MKRTRRVFAACVAIPLLALLLVPAARAQTQVTYSAEWCRQLPRPEYKALERVPVRSRWFEVYRIRPGVFALYEPHQAEEVISYLIVGSRQALLFDTGMGISSIRAVVRQLTKLPIIVLNSHAHYDHVGGNREFTDILGMDTAFTRERAAKGYFNEVMRTDVARERAAAVSVRRLRRADAVNPFAADSRGRTRIKNTITRYKCIDPSLRSGLTLIQRMSVV